MFIKEGQTLKEKLKVYSYEFLKMIYIFYFIYYICLNNI